MWQIRALPEQRVQVTTTRYRIPDVCVLRRSDPKDPIIARPPLLCIEVLSRDDTVRELQERVNDYSAMGVPHVWAVDPLLRVGYVASPRVFIQPEEVAYCAFRTQPLRFSWRRSSKRWTRCRVFRPRRGSYDQPPAIAPMIKNGSAPRATASGTRSSCARCERSSWQAKKRMKARRFPVP